MRFAPAARRAVVLVAPVLAVSTLAAPPAQAQDPTAAWPAAEAVEGRAVEGRVVEGRAVLRNWPDGQRPLTGRAMRRYAALPTLDSLEVGYRFSPAVGRSVPLELAVRWVPGATGILRGRRVPFAQMPEGLRLVGFVVEADVMQGRRRVATFTYSVDSTRLAARDVFAQRLDAPLAQVFDGLSEAEARRVLAEGFTLDRLRLTRAVFAVPRQNLGSAPLPEGRVGGAEARRRERQAVEAAERDVWLTVYTVDRALDLAYYAAWMERAVGRGEEDDERGELLGHAALAASAVATVGLLTGSAGTYLSADTPLGLTAGITRPGGGLLLQASTNAAALGMTGGTERVDVRLLGFRRFGRLAVMPLVGLGARLTDRPDGSYVAARDESRPLLTLGAVYPIGSALVLGGADVLTGAPELGLVWRWRR